MSSESADPLVRGNADSWRAGAAALSTAVAALPWTALTLLIAAASYVRLGFGRWPVVYMDNVDLPFTGAAVTVAVLAAMSLIPAFALFFLLAAVRWLLGFASSSSRSNLVFVVGWVVAVAVLRWTPIDGFLYWAMD